MSQENRKLENYLSKTKAKKSSKAVENIKGVNDYLGIVDKKNVSTICRKFFFFFNKTFHNKSAYRITFGYN